MTDFGLQLNRWYNTAKRRLPWRLTKDPYKIWISEIILQQTQVAQGLNYYLRFIDLFPNVRSLANAKEDEILKAWQGLGYYSRARNLHQAAKSIVDNHNGIFPNTYKKILELKGIGPYTAAAIASFAFELPHATVDGNVFRFLSRLFAIDTPIDSTIGKKEFDTLANELLDKKNPGEHNQAMMEIGATVCKPTTPLCIECPFSESCLALSKNKIANFPVKSKKAKQRPRYLNFFLIQENEQLFIEKRDDKDIWRNLYQLPMIETTKPKDEKYFNKSLKQPVFIIKEYKHVLSHQILHARFFATSEAALLEFPNNGQLTIDKKSLNQYAFPQLVVKFLKEQKLLFE